MSHARGKANAIERLQLISAPLHVNDCGAAQKRERLTDSVDMVREDSAGIDRHYTCAKPPGGAGAADHFTKGNTRSKGGRLTHSGPDCFHP